LTTLVTGSDGFVGRHLCALLRDRGETVAGLDLPAIDLLDPGQVNRRVRETAPLRVYHLAAVSSIGQSFLDRDLVFRVNVEGTRNLLAAVAANAPAARVLLVSTGAVYGPGRGQAFRETDPFRPANPYAESKVQAEQVAREFCERGLDARIARPLGHAGPGQRQGFVVPDLAAQVAAIVLGRSEPRLRAGNLQARREFADARDVVRAYRLILERGEPGAIYNLATNRPFAIAEVADILIRLAGVAATTYSDQALLRPADECSPCLDASRVAGLGFNYDIPLETTLADVLAEWLERIK
jgi:GDP-4-dehydro-6-deoxy-D-mannose reductase